MKLSGIRLLVNNYKACYNFYKDKLGLICSWGELEGDYARFELGDGLGLSIFKSELMAKAVGYENGEIPPGTRDKQAIILSVDDVDEEVAKLKSRSVAFLNDPTDMPGWGGRVVHLRDPDGNLIELYSELDRSKWDRDFLDEDERYRG